MFYSVKNWLNISASIAAPAQQKDAFTVNNAEISQLNPVPRSRCMRSCPFVSDCVCGFSCLFVCARGLVARLLNHHSRLTSRTLKCELRLSAMSCVSACAPNRCMRRAASTRRAMFFLYGRVCQVCINMRCMYTRTHSFALRGVGFLTAQTTA